MDSDVSRSPESLSNPSDEPDGGTSATGRYQLQREVLYPQRRSTGVGVMLVASAAMFFAVASSAFILRAQMPMTEECPRYVPSVHPHPGGQSPGMHSLDIDLNTAESVDFSEVGSVPCGEPIFHESANGPSTIVFRLCNQK